MAETRCELDPAGVPASFDDLPLGVCSTSVGADGQHTLYAASSDNAGNEESPPVSVSFMIDRMAPAVTCAQAAPGPVFLLQGAGGNVSATVTDGTSTSVSGAAEVATVGNRTVSLTGGDDAGNLTTVHCPYRVSSGSLGSCSQNRSRVPSAVRRSRSSSSSQTPPV